MNEHPAHSRSCMAGDTPEGVRTRKSCNFNVIIQLVPLQTLPTNWRGPKLSIYMPCCRPTFLPRSPTPTLVYPIIDEIGFAYRAVVVLNRTAATATAATPPMHPMSQSDECPISYPALPTPGPPDSGVRTRARCLTLCRFRPFCDGGVNLKHRPRAREGTGGCV